MQIKKPLVFQVYFGLVLLVSLTALFLFLSLPGDADNAAFLGYSWRRLAIAGVFLAASAAALVLFFFSFRTARLAAMEKVVQAVLDLQIGFQLIFLLLLNSVIASGIFFIYAFYDFPSDIKSILARLVPVVLWLLVVGASSLAALALLGGAKKMSQAAIVWLVTVLFYGAATHVFLLQVTSRYKSEQPRFVSYFHFRGPSREDIGAIYTHAGYLLDGDNMYTYTLENRENDPTIKEAAYLPGFYYLAALTRMIFTSRQAWFKFWEWGFLAFNLGIAGMMFMIPYKKSKSLVFALFASLFYLFNRWILHETMIMQFDYPALFFFLLSLYLFPRNKTSALLLFGISLSLKQVAIFMLPIYLIWIWQSAEGNKFKAFLRDSLIMGSIPFLVSLPFLIWNPKNFFLSIIYSATRSASSMSDVFSLDRLAGLSGLSSNIPYGIILLLVCLLAWNRKLAYFSAAFLVMLGFIDYNSTLFPQYFAWVTPLAPLALHELVSKDPKPPEPAAA